ncbi:MAG: hypothetical protein M9894_02645 [Planctomycetes bacterium]|nr:hypothetical protein [Planctomycetota bacterium]
MRRGLASCALLLAGLAGCAAPASPRADGYAREETDVAMRAALARTQRERVDALLDGASRRLRQLEVELAADEPDHAAALVDAYRLVVEQGLLPLIDEDDDPELLAERLNIDHALTWQLVRLDALRGRTAGPLRLELDGARRSAETARDRARRRDGRVE